MWKIDPETCQLISPEPSRAYSGAEFAALPWPPCPVCGATIQVDRLDIQSCADPLPVYIPGQWQCPNECDPRTPNKRQETELCVWYLSCGCVAWSPMGASSPFSTNHPCRQCGHAFEIAFTEFRTVDRAPQAPSGLTDEELHAQCAHPDYSYTLTEGPRKQWDNPDEPPDGEGWEKNTPMGRNGWERFEHTEETYWRRKNAL